jgi:hypothetical protein
MKKYNYVTLTRCLFFTDIKRFLFAYRTKPCRRSYGNLVASEFNQGTYLVACKGRRYGVDPRRGGTPPTNQFSQRTYIAYRNYIDH